MTLHFKFICRIMKNTLILISYITVLKFATEEWALPHFFKNYYCVFWLLFVLCFSTISLSLEGNLGCLTWVSLQQSQEQCYPILPMRDNIFMCAKHGVDASVWDF